MIADAEAVKYPELIFGLAGPIGVDMQELSNVVSEELHKVRYRSHLIRVTGLMQAYVTGHRPFARKADYYDDMMEKIDIGNTLCKHDNSFLARIAIREIQRYRKEIVKSINDKSESKDFDIPSKQAYILRQLKRPSEVYLLRRIYGRQFILVSAYGSEEDRKIRISEKIRNSISTMTMPSEVSAKSDKLIERDAGEEHDSGQQLRETFHMADVFVDGISKPEMQEKFGRFIQALFGRLDIAPSKYEYGMYAAKSASLRSADLSRQVGAAIFSDEGELIVQGCNEAPKALGGTYWDLEKPDYRDIKIGFDPNHSARDQLLRDLFERLAKGDLLSQKALDLGSPAEIVEAVSKKDKTGGAAHGALVGSKVMDITEYGRIVHAEMCAICDAARLGRSVKGATLFCTTFPCHNCAKHIIASGIKKVVYMEPYPKSQAKNLHKDEISIEEEISGKVSFIPFIGISPYRYRDIFQKERRKRSDGTSLTWYDDIMRPLIDVPIPSYPDAEGIAVAEIFTEFRSNEGGDGN